LHLRLAALRFHSTTEPITPAKSPFSVEVKAGETYFWCAGGRSRWIPSRERNQRRAPRLDGTDPRGRRSEASREGRRPARV